MYKEGPRSYSLTSSPTPHRPPHLFVNHPSTTCTSITMCPPGVDQTMRSAQQWLLYAPELEQRHSFTKADDGWGTKFTQITSGNGSFDAWELLARPAADSAMQVNNANNDCRRGWFDLLSNELIDMVLEHISEDSVDMMALGLTCEGFWELVSQHIHRTFLKSAAPWANTPIILQGSYATELPESMLMSPAVTKAAEGSSMRMSAARKLFWAGWSFDRPKTVTEIEDEWRSAADLHRESSRIPKDRWSQIETQLGSSYLLTKDQMWVLRNLTTKEVVSSQERTTRRGKTSTGTTFEDVLLMKTFWTTHPQYALDDDTECHPSDWAGHCFDIVTEKVHDVEAGEGWRDVTAEVEKEVEGWKKIKS